MARLGAMRPVCAMNTNKRHLEEGPAPDLSNAPLESWLKDELPQSTPKREWQHNLRSCVKFTDIYSEAHKEARHIERVRHRKPGSPAPRRRRTELPPPAQADGSQEWLLAQFQGFLEKLQQDLAAKDESPEETEEKPERIRPVRTPRSDVPMFTARPADLLRPEFSKGRLYFSCPCCRFPAALPTWLAGKKTRCPRCYSAIRAPHPGKKLSTLVLENDIESLLHPERFEGYYNAHRLIPWLGVPRPKLQPSFHLAAVTILLVMLCCWMPFALDRTNRAIQQLSALMQSPGKEGNVGFKDRATGLVEKFLAAENAAAKAAYVRDSNRVAPLMADWYQRQPGGTSVKPRAVEASGTGFYSAEASNPVTDVRVEMPDGQTSFYTVEHSPEGDRIEWEASVGYTADFKSLLERGPAAGPQTVRVLAGFDDYYNYDFTDSSTHFCVRLHDPVNREFLGYGYLPVEDAAAFPLATMLNGTSADELRPVQFQVEALRNSATSRQIKIVRVMPPASAKSVANVNP